MIKSIVFDPELLGSQTTHINDFVLFEIVRSIRFWRLLNHFGVLPMSWAVYDQNLSDFSQMNKSVWTLIWGVHGGPCKYTFEIFKVKSASYSTWITRNNYCFDKKINSETVWRMLCKKKFSISQGQINLNFILYIHKRKKGPVQILTCNLFYFISLFQLRSPLIL